MGNFQRVRNDIERAIDASLEAVGILVQGQVTELVPIDTGRLKGSITYATSTAKSEPRTPATSADAVKHDGSENTVLVGTNVEYAPYVEFGTGIYGPKGAPYEIKPKDAKALYWKGAAHPVKRVVHPGSPAKPFLRRGLELTKPDIPKVFKKTYQANR